MSLQTMLRDRGLKQVWVAKRLGLDDSSFSAMLRGERRLPVEKIEPLAELLQLPVSDVVEAASALMRGI